MSSPLEAYILKHIDTEPELLKEMDRDAHVNLLHPRMLSGHLQGRLLKMFTQMICPQNVLEIGTFTGYSALSIAEGLEKGATIHTIELNDEMEEFIQKYLGRSPYKKNVRAYFGDALDIIPKFENSFFDLVFIDADKRLYWNYFQEILPKVRKGGFLIADNTLWNGKVVGKVVDNDWQTKGILEFNDKLKHDERVEKVIIPYRDGLTLIRKK